MLVNIYLLKFCGIDKMKEKNYESIKQNIPIMHYKGHLLGLKA